MSFSLIPAQPNPVSTLASAVAANGTFTADYPSGKDAGNFFLTMAHKLSLNGATLYFPVDFDLTFGTSNITVTNKTSSTWAAGSTWRLQVEEPGERSQLTVPLQDPNAAVSTVSGSTYNINVRSKLIPSTTDMYLDLISLGAPDTAVTNGICQNQSLAALGALTMNGSLVAGGVATLDVPRALRIVSTGADTAVITCSGTDVYGFSMSEAMTLNGTTVVNGLKAFKTVNSVTAGAAIANLASVGTTDTLGLPVFVPDSGYLVAELMNGKLAGSQGAYQIPFQLSQNDLLVPVANNFVSPIAGNIVRATAVSQLTIVTGGNIAIKVGTTDVTGLTLVFADSTNPGTVVSDTPTTPGDATTVVAVGSRIQVAPDSSFNTSGAVNGFVEVVGTQGTFVAGIRTAGGSTTTTGDVRGTYKPFTACNATNVIQLLVAVGDRYAGIRQNQ